jgi:hypothetical protein
LKNPTKRLVSTKTPPNSIQPVLDDATLLGSAISGLALACPCFGVGTEVTAGKYGSFRPFLAGLSIFGCTPCGLGEIAIKTRHSVKKQVEEGRLNSIKA